MRKQPSHVRVDASSPAAHNAGTARPSRPLTDVPHIVPGAPSSGGADFSQIPDYSDRIIRVRKKHRKKKAKRIVLAVLAVVLVLVVGVGSAAALYANSLVGNMAISEQHREALDQALTPVDTQSKPFYVLVMGSDNWQTYGERSDALILTRVDISNRQITMVSVPRDTPYLLDGRTVKINQAFAEKGPAGAVVAVEELTGVEISHYVEVEFAGLAEFTDSLGGILVDVPYLIDYQVYTHDQPSVHIDAGRQLLNGEQVVALARMRTAYGDAQDQVRQSNVRAMALSLLKTVLDLPAVELPGAVQRLSECISTDIPIDLMLAWAQEFAGRDVTVYSCTGPSDGAIMPEHGGLWLCYEDPEGWADLMRRVDAGEDPDAAVGDAEAEPGAVE